MMDRGGVPRRMTWNYDRAELIADGVVHILGVGTGLIASVILVVIASRSADAGEIASVVIYAVALLAMLGFSATYNMWPLSPLKWILRRFDHSAIYLLIAGTYTPFAAQLKAGLMSAGLLIGIWGTAIAGMSLKLLLPGRFDRLSVVLYLLLGWSGVFFYNEIVASLTPATLWLLAAGGLLYSAGVVFHVWQSLRFQNAIWHSFVLAAAAVHYSAVLTCVAVI
ncbi:MAG: PAQR family membrane homeostasis protein TrhA [Xanthobacteraceae bacterium]